MRIVYLFIILTFAACKNEPKEVVVEKSNSAVTKTGNIQIDDFTGLNLSIDATLIILKGDKQNVEIKGPIYQIESLKKKVINGTWNIEYGQDIEDVEQMSVTVHTPNLKSLTVTGDGRAMTNRNVMDTISAQFNVAGNGTLKAMLESNEDIDVSLAGNGNIDLVGSSVKANYTLSGAGLINASNLVVDAANVTLTGSGTCEVNVKTDLDVTLTGSGNVLYKGDPNVKESITGPGSIKRVK